ncbi:MAG: methylthioribose-1-phosphate isomerase [Verrucomicrobiales bacterium]|jgi:methylthioribose-1-phosphate isomerase
MEGEVVRIIDQRALPFDFVLEGLASVDEVAVAIKDMHVRGAGCIGATAGYGMLLATREALRSDDFETTFAERAQRLVATRPTATNLSWAVDRILNLVKRIRSTGNLANNEELLGVVRAEADLIADEDAAACERIGEHGLEIIRGLAAGKKSGETVNILTHCNAGWLAFVDHGSATAPIYAAHRAGIPVHVWVDETRPRNQGARLTAWELAQEGVPHTLIVDNAGGHLMQRGQVDMVITGTDRTTFTGDVANKIGTYLKALAAKDNNIPFYVSLPSSTFDWECRDGVAEIPIEERGSAEVTEIEGQGLGVDGDLAELRTVRLSNSLAANPAFDVTPARLVTGLITERGICAASEAGILGMFPERR